MTNWRNIGDAPGLSGPPDPEPTILDDIDAVEELLSEKEVGPDFVVTALADLLVHNFSDTVWERVKRDLDRHLTPWIEEADRKAKEPDDAEPDDD